MDWEHKYQKYRTKYEELKKRAQLGGNRSKRSKRSKRSRGGKSKSKGPKHHRERKPDTRPALRVACVEVDQKRKDPEQGDVKFTANICKTPAIRVRVSEEKTNWAKVVKILTRFVSSRLRMKEVSKIEVTVGKKTTTIKGDQLGTTSLDLSKTTEVDRVKIIF